MRYPLLLGEFCRGFRMPLMVLRLLLLLTVLAASCKTHTQNVDSNSSLAADVNRAPPSIRTYLQGLPDYLVSDREPQFATLRGIDAEKFFRTHGTAPYSVFATAAQLQVLAPFFDHLRAPGTYYFLGNGMRAAQVVLATMFEDTHLRDRFVFLPLSRGIIRREGGSTPQQMNAYLTRLGIANPDNGRIFVVDTTTPGQSNDHSVQQFARQVAEHLIQKGTPQALAWTRVVPIAIPETGAISYGRYDATNIADFDAKFPPGSVSAAFQPWINIKQGTAYGLMDPYGLTRWDESKYDRFDANGEPRLSNLALQNLIDRGVTNFADYQQIITNRIQYVATYLGMIRAVRQNRNMPFLQRAYNQIANDYQATFPEAKAREVDPPPAPVKEMPRDVVKEFTGKTFDIGEELVVEGRRYRVVDIPPTTLGPLTEVTLAEVATGKKFVLVYTNDARTESRELMNDLREKAEVLSRRGTTGYEIPAKGNDFFLKAHAGEELASDWLDSWARTGFLKTSRKYQQMEEFFRNLIRDRIYIENLYAEELRWNGSSWIYIGDKAIITAQDGPTIAAKMQDKIPRRFGRIIKDALGIRDTDGACQVLREQLGMAFQL